MYTITFIGPSNERFSKVLRGHDCKNQTEALEKPQERNQQMMTISNINKWPRRLGYPSLLLQHYYLIITLSECIVNYIKITVLMSTEIVL